MLARLFIALVRVYQRLLSPVVNAFGPLACIEEHGALRGSLLSLLRLCKCQPFHPGGYDPPPVRPAPTPSLPSRAG